MRSPLDYVNSEVFRERLMVRNLAPYRKSPSQPNPPITFPYEQSNISVIDSPDALIDTPVFADRLYPLNQYGADGGYKQVPDPNALLNTKSNEGEYGPGQQDAHIIDQAPIEAQRYRPLNAFGPGNSEILDSGEMITEPEWIVAGSTRGKYQNQPYPARSVFSSYSPVTILLSRDPIGSNGLLSQDTYLAQLGAASLRKEFEERIATQIRQQTIARANLFNVDSGTDVLNLVSTRVPLIEPNWVITVPSNPILAATDFALRLAGSIIPISPIPGSYFDPNIRLGPPTTIQQIQNAFRRSNIGVGNFFANLLGPSQTGSQIFLSNTGGGQRSRLFGNINYNKFKPNYERNIFDRLGGALVGTTENNSNFYIGNTTTEPSRILSPSGDLPVNEFGQEVQAPVYGPQELAQLYEGPSQDVKLGANGPAYVNGGGIEGGFTWVSPKYRGNAGKKVGIGGEVIDQDQDFKPSSYNSTESTNRNFREGSILDDTQRLIDSQPQGGRRLQHVGNAIDQVSKVFNDGYKELTKGSKVLKYVGSLGNEVGTEYCRVFTKDVPYLQYNDLQKQDGIVNQNRRFSYSVLDSTFNLNIAPNKQEGGTTSSNLIGNGNASRVKKYMFSLENLAWRTSNTPGINVNDLPSCERGPNGGRIMWFPPYGLTFSENVNANWKGNDFLGRPEPIYTYTNTTRTGTLQWKIVVDHPSVLNVIVNKILNNNSNKERIDGLLESFFAGCKKYDLYELAKKYEKIPFNELQTLQSAITSRQLSREQLGALRDDQASGALTTQNASQLITQPVQDVPQQSFKEFENFALFFPNDLPRQNAVVAYPDYYTIYTQELTSIYTGQTQTNFFNTVITPNYLYIKDELFPKLKNVLKNNSSIKITINLFGSASAAGTQSYNLRLSEDRISSVKLFFSSDSELNKYIQQGRITFLSEAKGENANVQEEGQKFEFRANPNYGNSCSNDIDNDTTNYGDALTSATAMACRRVVIKSIVVSSPEATQLPPQPNIPGRTIGVNSIQPLGQAQIETRYRPTDNISKRVVRAMISECDYFEEIKRDTPMVYDNLKDKLKFFQPAFHSTTPEGLNSRLTFLQQCMRPGDTIPTVKPNADQTYSLEYNNAVNTAFGIPPVLILRVGDFYNTKIIPDGLQLSFEQLDINPEGIGVQPMIANVTLNFKFVGGSGLKDAVDKLQNALTFNYYANTEIWDERADPTDDSYKILDKEFLQNVAQPGAPTTNQVQNINSLSNANTIGNRESYQLTQQGEEGVMSYQQFMDSFVSSTQTYFQTIFNQSKSVLNQYNNAMLQQWSTNRIYQQGQFLVAPGVDTYIFGKPDEIQKNVDKIFSDLIVDIESNDSTTQDRFINFINISTWDFSQRAIRQIKDNYLKFVKDKKSSYLSAITKIIQDVVNVEQTYLQYVSRTNVVPFDDPGIFDGTDGFQEANGNIVVYNLSATTEVGPTNPGSTAPANTKIELEQDITIVQESLNDFFDLTKSGVTFTEGTTGYTGYLISGVSPAPTNEQLRDQVFIPFNKSVNFGSTPFRRQYMILSNDLKSEVYQTFKNAILGNIINNRSLAGDRSMRYEEVFDAYWLGIAKKEFDEEDRLAKKFMDTVESGLSNYLNFTPFPSKPRKFTFYKSTNPDPNQKTLINLLGAKTNVNTDKTTWNDEYQNLNTVLVSKVKLN